MNIEQVARKPVFDTVREMLGRGFTRPEVRRLDAAIDRMLGIGQPETPRAARLGALSERYESGGRGPGTVSSGAADPGGVSYGIYQLASRTGTVARFVANEGKPWARALRAAPGSAAFSAAWRKVAARSPEEFAQAQHAFIRRTHYDPAVAGVRRATGVNLDGFEQAVRDVVWSVAVQHGGAVRILSAAIGAAGAGDPRALIEAIYAERTAYVLRVAGRMKGAARRTLERITQLRYPQEREDALAMLNKQRSEA